MGSRTANRSACFQRSPASAPPEQKERTEPPDQTVRRKNLFHPKIVVLLFRSWYSCCENRAPHFKENKHTLLDQPSTTIVYKSWMTMQGGLLDKTTPQFQIVLLYFAVFVSEFSNRSRSEHHAQYGRSAWPACTSHSLAGLDRQGFSTGRVSEAVV